MPFNASGANHHYWQKLYGGNGAATTATTDATATVVVSNPSVTFVAGEIVDFRPQSVPVEYGTTGTIHDGNLSEDNDIE